MRGPCATPVRAVLPVMVPPAERRTCKEPGTGIA
jgi:hypothetical protein